LTLEIVGSFLIAVDQGDVMRTVVVLCLLLLVGCSSSDFKEGMAAAARGFAAGSGAAPAASSTPIRSSYEVTCITRDRRDPGRRIDSIGGPYFNVPIDNAIRAVETGTVLYTSVRGRVANVTVATQDRCGRVRAQ